MDKINSHVHTTIELQAFTSRLSVCKKRSQKFCFSHSLHPLSMKVCMNAFESRKTLTLRANINRNKIAKSN